MVATFEEFKDREDVLRKANMLKGTNIHVTEDMSRYTITINCDDCSSDLLGGCEKVVMSSESLCVRSREEILLQQSYFNMINFLLITGAMYGMMFRAKLQSMLL